MSDKNKWIGNVPNCCDICKEEIVDVFIDGRIGLDLTLPWGFMCEPCHSLSGVTLAWGHGQKYKKINQDWICVEGMQKNYDL